MNTKNAFIIILGRPNVGKSSLLNAFLGERIAAVSAKPQTTRTKITGVLTKDETQYVFIDTPGIHKAKNKLSEKMLDAIDDSITTADIMLLVVDATKNIGESEEEIVKKLSASKSKVFLVINKIDLIEDKDKLLEVITKYSSLMNFEAVIPVSVVNNDGVDIIIDELSKAAVEGPHFFPDDAITDQPEKVLASEMIREQLLNLLNEEIPHGIAVTIERMSERETSSGEDILDIDANIYCERESHKGIIIGKGGNMLKLVGERAREELESFFRIRVNLKCWVKVKEGWRNKEALIKNFGLSD